MKTQFREYLRQLGSRGGRTAAANMTRTQRIARAKKASAAAHRARRTGGAR